MITYGHIINSILGSLPLTLKVLKDSFGVEEIQISPREGSPLFSKKNRRVSLRPDLAISPVVLTKGCWQNEEIEFAKTIMKRDEKFSLVDVGANIGLFSRQYLNYFSNIESTWCYEPNLVNFNILKKNVENLSEFIEVLNYGLSDLDGSVSLYEESDNSGNYSIYRNAILPNEPFTVSTIQMKNVKEEVLKWEKADLVFYKSDTQGHDEKIICSIPADFWKRVRGGIIEVWRLEKAPYDFDAFVKFLDAFPKKIFLDNPKNVLTTKNVVDYLRSKNDHDYKDLGFWK
jgi:FkbM family methyltransferase